MVCVCVYTLLPSASWGAFTGPDMYGYMYETGAPYAWEEIDNINYGGTGTLITWTAHRSGNLSYVKLPLGFKFNYYGQLFDSLYVMSTGWVSFTDRDNAGIPSTNPFPYAADNLNGVIAPLILTFDIETWPDFCYYQTQGTAPDRMFIVEWSDAKSMFNDEKFSFQVIFYENTGQFSFQYNYVADNGTSSSPEPSHVGIESPNDLGGFDLGVQTTYNQAGKPSDNTAIRFGRALHLTTPVKDTTVGSTWRLTWLEMCDSAAAPISLYWDNGRDTTGTLITSQLTIADSNYCQWSPLGFSRFDSVYMYGVLHVGGRDIISYSTHRVVFTAARCSLALNTPERDTLVTGPIRLAWDSFCGAVPETVALYWDHGRDTTGTLIGRAVDVAFYDWTPTGFTAQDTLCIYARLQYGAQVVVAYAPGRLLFNGTGINGPAGNHAPGYGIQNIPGRLYRLDGTAVSLGHRPRLPAGLYLEQQCDKLAKRLIVPETVPTR
jgi:hypothetical protein